MATTNAALYRSPSASVNGNSVNPSAWSREDQDAFLASEQNTYTGICIQAILRKQRQKWDQMKSNPTSDLYHQLRKHWLRRLWDRLTA